MNTKLLPFTLIAVVAVATVTGNLVKEAKTAIKQQVKIDSSISNSCPGGSASVKTNETSITEAGNSYPTIVHVDL